jgi:hypothetical protein
MCASVKLANFYPQLRDSIPISIFLNADSRNRRAASMATRPIEDWDENNFRVVLEAIPGNNFENSDVA